MGTHICHECTHDNLCASPWTLYMFKVSCDPAEAHNESAAYEGVISLLLCMFCSFSWQTKFTAGTSLEWFIIRWAMYRSHRLRTSPTHVRFLGLNKAAVS